MTYSHPFYPDIYEKMAGIFVSTIFTSFHLYGGWFTLYYLDDFLYCIAKAPISISTGISMDASPVLGIAILMQETVASGLKLVVTEVLFHFTVTHLALGSMQPTVKLLPLPVKGTATPSISTEVGTAELLVLKLLPPEELCLSPFISTPSI